MISREFFVWMASKPIRLIFMVSMVMVLTFCLVMLFGMNMHQAELREIQIQQIREIEAEAARARDEAARAKDEAARAKAEALKTRTQTEKNAMDVKQIEKAIREDR